MFKAAKGDIRRLSDSLASFIGKQTFSQKFPSRISPYILLTRHKGVSKFEYLTFPISSLRSRQGRSVCELGWLVNRCLTMSATFVGDVK